MEKFSNTKAILFDLDGTLFQTDPELSEAINLMLSDLKMPGLKKDNIKNTSIFNSCAVTSETVRQVRQSIRKRKREFPEDKIIVTGCAAQIEPKTFSDMKEVDIVSGNME